VGVFLATSVLPLYAVPGDGQTPPRTGITTDIAPDVQRPLDGPSQAESDEARDLLERATPAQRADLQRLFVQLDALDRETEIAVEEHNAARMRLDYVRGTIEVSRQDLLLLEQAYVLQAERLGERAVEIYTGGQDQLLALLFGAQSLADLLARLQIIQQMTNTDADLIARIRNQRSRLETIVQHMEQDADEAASLEFEMRARMIEITSRNEDRALELREQNVALTQLYEAAQLRDNQAESDLAWRIISGNHHDIVIVPGSPVESAMALRGIPYLWGGASRRGFDCSGLVRFVFAQHGVDLPHHSGSQVLFGRRITGIIEPNDVVFFGTPIHHVGIYVGGGYFIHAPRAGDVVSLARLANRRDLVAVRRYDWQPRIGAPR